MSEGKPTHARVLNRDCGLTPLERRLRDALMQIRHYFIDLENGTQDDDPLKRLRKLAHAPFHRVIDAALSEADAKEGQG